MANTRRSQRDSLWVLYVKELYDDALGYGFESVSDHVVVEAFRPIPSRVWTDLQLQLIPALSVRVMSVRGMQVDLRMTKEEFLGLMPLWRTGGVHAWFFARPCPDTLRVLDLPEEKRQQILAPLGFTLDFSWPLPAISDWACLVSPRLEIIERLELAFAQR